MASPGFFPLTVVNGQIGKALRRTFHKVSLPQTGETGNSVAVYTNFSILEKEIPGGFPS